VQSAGRIDGTRRSSGVTLWMEGEPRQGRICREIEGVDGSLSRSATGGGRVFKLWLPGQSKSSAKSNAAADGDIGSEEA
jgi:hypothetical protein